VRSRRARFATPHEAQLLIEAAPAEDRVLWATAFYAGLRRGELRALRWIDVDLAGGVLRVERSWDVKEGVIEPKSFAGRRKVPIAAVLRDYLIGHRLDSRDGLVFGRTDGTPFVTSSVSLRASKTWKGAELRPVTLHECRHTFASLMIAAGVNPKALQTFMGHSSITVTLDRYGTCSPDPKRRLPSSWTPILRNLMSEHARRQHPRVRVRGNRGETEPLQERS
jgi:integrase